MAKRKFPVVKNLIEQAEAMAAPEAASALDELASSITAAIQAGSDPYAMAGLLVEAVAATIAARVPPKQQPEAAQVAIELLHERLAARDVI